MKPKKVGTAFIGSILKLPCGLAPKAFNNTTKSFEYTPACPADTAGGPVLLHECKLFMWSCSF